MFKNIETKVSLEHKTCGHKWESSPKKHIYYKQGCPNYNDSIGEKDIKISLNDANIKYVIQKKFDDCRNINPLPFDFYLQEYNTCIEYDGEFHYKSVKKFGGDRKLETQRNHDKIKNKWCLDNNINLIRIPYNKKSKIFQILKENLK